MAIQTRPYPRSLREALAALHLSAAEAATLIAAERERLELEASWQNAPTPPELHNLNGRDGVWWREVGGLE